MADATSLMPPKPGLSAPLLSNKRVEPYSPKGPEHAKITTLVRSLSFTAICITTLTILFTFVSTVNNVFSNHSVCSIIRVPSYTHKYSERLALYSIISHGI